MNWGVPSGRHRDGRAGDGVGPAETGSGAAASIGSGKPVRQSTFPEHAEGIRHGGLHESQGSWMG